VSDLESIIAETKLGPGPRLRYPGMVMGFPLVMGAAAGWLVGRATTSSAPRGLTFAGNGLVGVSSHPFMRVLVVGF
jgi:hypothetical protein